MVIDAFMLGRVAAPSARIRMMGWLAVLSCAPLIGSAWSPPLWAVLVLWTLAIAGPDLSLSKVARETAALALARPRHMLALGFALLVVNVAGIAAAVMPFLTLTLAYTFLVTARILVGPEEEAA